jgi:hypothetical protein
MFPSIISKNFASMSMVSRKTSIWHSAPLLAQLNLPEGIYTVQLHGARGLDPIQFAYLPNLNLRLDKNEYRANESPSLSYQ